MLNSRQQLFYKYRVAIFRPQSPQASTLFSGSPQLQADLGAIYILNSASEYCMFWSTPENDVPTPMGRTKAVNIFTMDRWKFPASTDVQDADLLVCIAGPNGFDQTGRVWAVQGNTQNHATLSVSNTQMVYAKLISCPESVRAAFPQIGL